MEEEKGLQDRTVIPGQLIAGSTTFMPGSGTFEEEGKIYSLFAGRVNQTDKYTLRYHRLLTVVPFKRRYVPEIGDVVVGRIVAVEESRWKIEIGAAQFGTLQLTAALLPGGEQRKRMEQDKLRMREIFKENDLISAEVHSVNAIDGRINLQTRNIKFGKVRFVLQAQLVNGCLVQVKASLIERMKSHFLTLQEHICMVLGMNGWVWVYYDPDQTSREQQESFDLKKTAAMQLENLYESSKVKQTKDIPRAVRQKIAYIRNRLKQLNDSESPINMSSLS